MEKYLKTNVENKETKRASTKAEQESYDLAQKTEKKLVDYILTKENLKLV